MNLVELIDTAYEKKHTIEQLVDQAIMVATLPAIAMKKRPNHFKKEITHGIELNKMPIEEAVEEAKRLGLDSSYHNEAVFPSDVEKCLWICQKIKAEHGLCTDIDVYVHVIEEVTKLLATWVYSTRTPRAALNKIGVAAATNLDGMYENLGGDVDHLSNLFAEILTNSSVEKMETAKVYVKAAGIAEKWAIDAANKGMTNKAHDYTLMSQFWTAEQCVKVMDKYSLIEELSGLVAMKKVLGLSQTISNIRITKPDEAQYLLDNSNILFGIDESERRRFEDQVRMNHE